MLPALIAEELGGLAQVAQHDVQLTVLVVVKDREPATIFDTVGPIYKAHIGEGAVAVIAKEAVSLAAVQAVRADADQSPRLRVASTDALEHVESNVVRNLAGDEAVGGVDIQPAVIVVVEELRPPAPLGVADPGRVAQVGEGAVAVVVEQRAPPR